MITMYNIRQYQDKLENKYADYEYVGLRIVDSDYDDYNAEVGGRPAQSYVWIDGEHTDEKINGTCAIDLRRKVRPVEYAGYSGNRILVLVGDKACYGEDTSEIILKNATIIEIINV